MNRRIIISTGGTGGHVYPAQALAEQFMHSHPDSKIAFLGGGLATNPFFASSSYAFKDIACSPLSFNKVLAPFKISKGFAQSLLYIRSFKPEVIVSFGSYHSLPVLLGAKLARIPIVLFESNSMPGRVSRLFSSTARCTCVYMSNATKYMKGSVVEVPFPLREGYTRTLSSLTQARRYFDLDPNTFTILVFGGSQGAMRINMDFASTAMDLTMRTDKFQVIHLIGNKMSSDDISLLYKDMGIRYAIKNFEEFG